MLSDTNYSFPCLKPFFLIHPGSAECKGLVLFVTYLDTLGISYRTVEIPGVLNREMNIDTVRSLNQNTAIVILFTYYLDGIRLGNFYSIFEIL